jgi:hypothetical protein
MKQLRIRQWSGCLYCVDVGICVHEKREIEQRTKIRPSIWFNYPILFERIEGKFDFITLPYKGSVTLCFAVCCVYSSYHEGRRSQRGLSVSYEDGFATGSCQ